MNNNDDLPFDKSKSEAFKMPIRHSRSRWNYYPIWGGPLSVFARFGGSDRKCTKYSGKVEFSVSDKRYGSNWKEKSKIIGTCSTWKAWAKCTSLLEKFSKWPPPVSDWSNKWYCSNAGEHWHYAAKWWTLPRKAIWILFFWFYKCMAIKLITPVNNFN